MVDAGMGDRWTDKLRRIYDIRPAESDGPGLDPASVTDVVLTHLHFDHARGIFSARSGPEESDGRPPLPGGPRSTSRRPTTRPPRAERRERASYVAEDVRAPRPDATRPHLGLPGDLSGSSGSTAVTATRADTSGSRSRARARPSRFPADIVPTSRHLPLPYLMGYDISAEKLARRKGRTVEPGCRRTLDPRLRPRPRRPGGPGQAGREGPLRPG